jgi:SAM-dependent methyltransferase
VGYHDWHEQPGYWRDVTRHFAPHTRMLDVGCGSAWLASHFENYTGVDGSSDAVARAVARGRNALVADVDERLPFEDDAFDGAILKDLLEHVRDPVAVVREVRRVVAPGGRVFASSPDAQRWVWDDYTHRRPFTRKAFRLLFADQGFEVERVGYESVAPGTSIVSARLPSHRRPMPLRGLAWLPVWRRNVWIVAVVPANGSR